MLVLKFGIVLVEEKHPTGVDAYGARARVCARVHAPFVSVFVHICICVCVCTRVCAMLMCMSARVFTSDNLRTRPSHKHIPGCMTVPM